MSSFLKTTFLNQGYLVLENFITNKACSLLIKRAYDLISEAFLTNKLFLFPSHMPNLTIQELETLNHQLCFFLETEDITSRDFDLSTLKKRMGKISFALHNIDPVFSEFSRQISLQALLKKLGWINTLLVQSMFIFKQAKLGRAVACHQDHSFLYTEPSGIIGLWFALEDATVNNGCLWVYPGHHKGPLKARFKRTDCKRLSYEILDPSPWPEQDFTPLEVKQGSLIVLDGMLPHFSKENTSSKSRHAYTLHLMNGICSYASDNWLQPSSIAPFKGFKI